MRALIASALLLATGLIAAPAQAQPPDISARLSASAIPDPPTNPIARAMSATAVRLSWSPGDGRGAPFTDWIASYSSDGGATWTTFDDGVSRVPVITVTGLTAGEQYGFRIVGVTPDGTSRPTLVSVVRAMAGALGAGHQHLCAATVDGSVVCWGMNSYGQFGIASTTSPVSEPVPNPADADRAVQVSAGTDFTCYLLATGAARCAGLGTSGQLGNNTILSSTTYVPVDGLSGATRIASGGGHTCVILADETISCWGKNDRLQVSPNAGNKPVPTPYAGLSDVVDLALGNLHTCVLLDTGEVKCWGLASSSDPTIGNGTTSPTGTPATVETSAGVALSGITAISARNATTCALRGSDGTVWCWGRGAEGQIGVGTTNAATRATQVDDVSGAVDVAVASLSACAVLANGRMKCWGDSSSGQIGDGLLAQRLRPVDVAGITNAVEVVAADKTVCARLQTRALRCWGRGEEGQLGNAALARSSTATAPRVLVPTLATPTRPSSPSGVTLAGRTGTSMTIAWTAPDYDGGSAITDYLLEYAVAGSSTWTTFADGTSSERRATITGLLPNVEYNVRVSAVNAQGASDPKPMQQTASRVAHGNSFGCALLVNATVACWGSNLYGQLGNGAALGGSTARLQSVIGLAGVTQVAAGAEHACAIAGATKQLHCWGRNDVGQLGIGTLATTATSTPRVVSGMTDVAQVATIEKTTCARKVDGSVWCWGANGSGQVGNGATTNVTAPHQVADVADVVSIGVGHTHVCVVLASGEVRCWGNGSDGRLGNGATTQQAAPVAVSGITTATSVVAGNGQTCALLIDGTVMCWGANGAGQVGDGTTTGRLTPVSVPGLAGVTQIFAGSNHACALAQGGVALCWGRNVEGQLGEGAASGSRTLPTAVASDVSFTSLSGGRTSTCGAVDGVTQLCWGANNDFRLGDATNVTRFAPVSLVKTTLLPTLPDPPLQPTARWRDATTIEIAWSPGANRGAAITDYRIQYTRDNGVTWATLDDGVSTVPRATLAGAARDGYSFRITAVTANGVSLPADTSAAVQVAGGDGQTCALLTDGGVSCWGAGTDGRLGTLTSESRTSPTTLERIGRATQIDVEHQHACARIADGTVRCWGLNSNGQLGNGTTATSVEPVQVSGITTATQVATGSAHSCALLADGTVRCWGRNSEGQLGDGTQTAQSTTPVAVAGLTDVAQMVAGERNTCARLTDGTVKCWGQQSLGRLGNGETATASVLEPTTVLTGPATPLTGVARIAANFATVCATLNDGTVRCWGSNGSGQVGDGTITNRGYATPVIGLEQAPSLTGVADVRVATDSACARHDNGSVTCWGRGVEGQLGNGAADPLPTTSAPTAVSGITSATALGGGYRHWCAVLAEGGVRCWGSGAQGEMGSGTGGVNNGLTAVNRSPVATQGLGAPLTALTAPQAPRNVVVSSAQGTSATLQWTAPAYDGGSAITDYRVEYSEVGTGRWYSVQRTASTATSQTVTGLGPGLAYTFRVAAVNAQGTGPSAAPELTGVRSIAAGATQTFCVVKVDGSVWCWGRNEYGQLGAGTSVWSAAPVRVSGITNATAVAVGTLHACALLADRTVRCWGRNEFGQLGAVSTVTSSSVPVAVRADSSGAPLADVTGIAVGGNTSCALLASGAVRCWGDGRNGEMGRGTIVNANYLPLEPMGLDSGVAEVVAGAGTICARLTAGGARCWGTNGQGQVGQGTVSTRVTTPTAVTAASGFRSIVPGANGTCVVMNDSTVRCWGRNNEGQLGIGTTARELVGVTVQGLEDVRSLTVSSITACAVLGDGTARCWGRGNDGQIGDGAAANRGIASPVKDLSGVTALAASISSTCAVVSGTVRCWGSNTHTFLPVNATGYGQLGDGTTASSRLPIAVVASTTAADVAQRITGLTIAAQTGTSVLLQWDPTTGNGAPLTGYEVAYSSNGGATWTVVPTGGSTSPSVEISGLQIGTSYSFRVRARTANGLGRAGFHAGATSVSAGNGASCAVLTSGDVQCWGLNSSGQLGDGTQTRRTLPVTPYEVGRASQVVQANAFTCALLVGGTVRCWGLGTSGQMGDGAFTSSRYPSTVGLPSAASALATGYGQHMCAILEGSGQVWCWGTGTSGQLGDGRSTNRSTPVRATGITNAISVAVGESHTCAALQGGTVKCWGANTSGQFGNNTTTASATPVDSNATGAVEVGAGKNHTCARLTDGTVDCWGVNGSGQVGDSTTTTPRLTPTGGDGVSGATKLVVGENHSCVLIANGEIRCWGANGSRQLGDNSTSNRTTAVAPSGSLTGAVSIAAGSVHSCAAFADGQVRCWGTQTDGALGNNSTTLSGTPVLTLEIEPTFTSAASAPGVVRNVAVSGRSGSTVSLRWQAPQRDGGSPITDYRVDYSADGTNWTTFTDGVSAVPATTVTGLNASTGYAFRVSATNAVNTGPAELIALGGTQVAAGGAHACAIAATGAVNCWGVNTYGQIGDGTVANATFPVKVPDVAGATSVATGNDFTCVALATGGVRCWGRGELGQLGNGLTSHSSTPVSAIGIATARQLTAAYNTACARLGDGTVRCWGLSNVGQIGNGLNASSTTPQPVSDLTGVTAIASGEHHTCAIKSPGQVWCWGMGTNGQLGNGTTTNSNVPVRAGTITTAIAIAAGGRTTCALLADRSVQCWGRNGSYQVADGTTANRTTPTAVAALDQVASLAVGSDYVCAVFTSNAGTCWGANTDGRLGTNDTVLRQTPAVIFGETRFTQIAAGGGFTCAVATDATIRCWGDAGSSGAFVKLGDGSTVDRPRPGAVALVTRTPTAPGAPTALAATAGNQRVRLAWTAPATDGDSPLTGYRAYVTTDPSLSCTTTVGQTANPNSCTVTGLANDTAYTFEVEAINAIGPSTPSGTASATPIGNAPTGADDRGDALEAGGAANATAGADPMGNVLLNDLTPDQTAGGSGSEVVAIRTGSVKGAGAVGVVGVPLAGAYGSLTVESGGAFTYIVDNESANVQALRAGEVVRDYFNYTVSYSGPTDVGLVEIVITGANDAPVAQDDSGTARESGGTGNDVSGEDATGDVLTNDVDVDANASIAVASVRTGLVEGAGTAGTVGSPTAGQYGTLILRANGTYTYAVDEDSPLVQALADGQTLVDGFNYTITDGTATDSGLLRVTIAGADDAPTLTTQGTATYVEQAAARFLSPTIALDDIDSPTLASATVRITAGDVAGDTLSFAGDPFATGNITATWNAAERRLTLASAGATATLEQWRVALGSVQFRNAASDTPGTSRTLSWTVSDGELDSATTTTTIAITPVNDAPTLQALTRTPPENEVVAFDQGEFTSRYADPEGTPLAGITVTALPNAGRLALSGQAVEEGQFITTDEIDSLTYTPVTQDATARSFTVTASDGERSSAPVQVTLAFVYVNDPPTTSSAALSTLITTSVPLGVDSFGAYADPEAVALAAVVITQVPANGALEFQAEDGTWSAVTAGQSISAAQLEAGRLRYTPAAGETGQPYTTFQYRVSDGGVSSRFAYTMTVTVTASNIAPVVNVPGTQTTAEDVALAFGAGSGNAITVTDPDSTVVTVRASVPSANGRLSVGTQTSAYVGGNNTGQIVLTGPPAEVNAALSTLRYTPTANASGTGYATITITADDRFATTSGTVAVDVTAVEDAPVLTTIAALTGATEDAPYAIAYADLLAASDASDPEGAAITFRVTAVTTGTLTKGGSPVVAGTTTIGTGESLVWTPPANQVGTLRAFSVQAGDGALWSAAAAVRVTVAGADDAPSSTDDSATTDEDTALVLGLSDFGAFTDPEGAALGGIRVTSLPAAGTLQRLASGVWSAVSAGDDITAAAIGDGRLRFVPAANASGSPYATIGFRVSDGNLLSASAYALAITVRPSIDPPTFAAQTTTALTDTGAYDTFANRTGSLVATSPDGAITPRFGIAGDSTNAEIQTAVGRFGSLTVTAATGAYVYIADRDAINRLAADGSDVFRVTAAIEGGGTTTTTLTVPITAVPEALTIRPAAVTKGYGDPDPALTYIVSSGTLIGDDTFAGGMERAPGEAVGTYPISRGSLEIGSAYDVTFVPRNLTITNRRLTVTVTAATKTYGDASDPTPVVAITSGSLLEGDALTGAPARAPGQTAGTYAYALGTLSAGPNYDLTVTGSLQIARKGLTVSGARVETRDADGTRDAQITGATLVGVVGSDDVQLTDDATGTFAQADAGQNIPVTTAMTLTGDDAGNYTLTQPTLTGEITATTREPRTLLLDTVAPLAAPYALDASTLPTLIATPSAGTGAITYRSSTPSVCTADALSGAVRLTGAGTCTLTASIAATPDHVGALSGPVTFTVTPILPSAPTITSVTGRYTQLEVAFALGSTGGATPTNLEYSLDGGAWTALDPAATTSPVMIPDLVNDTAYSVRLRVVAPGGTSGPSNAVSGTPTARTIEITTDVAPTYAFTASPPTITAEPSVSGGEITYATTTPTTCLVDDDSGAVSFLRTGTCGVTATVSRTASLNQATAPPETFAIAPVAPDPPTISSITPGVGKLTVAFIQGANGGAAPTNVEYSTNGGTQWTAASPTTTSSPLVISGLTNGTAYSVKLRMIGPGGPSGASNAMTGTPTAIRTISITSSIASSYLFNGLPPTVVATPSEPGGAITYSSSTTPVCTVNAGTGKVTFVSAGTCTVAAAVAASGSLNAATSASRSFQVQAVAPAEPTLTSILPSSQTLTIEFEPGSNGGAEATNVEYTLNGGGTWIPRAQASVTSPLTITGLTNGTAYSVQLRMVNAVGPGAASEPLTETPNPPVFRTITNSGAASTYAFDAVPPTIVGSPSTAGGTVTYASSTPNVCTIDRLSGEVSFVAAGSCSVTSSVAQSGVLQAATSAATTFSITAVVPSAPSITAIVAGDRELRVYFTLGYTGGAPITNLSFTTNNSSYTTRSPASVTSPLVISGLENDTTYTVALKAINSAGASDASDAVSETPVVPADRSISITSALEASYAFDAVPPTLVGTPSGGGGDVTYATTTPGVCTVNETTGEVAFVSAGTCTVSASVPAVTGFVAATSEARSFAVTAVAPGAPTISTITPGDQSLSVAFALGSTGGEAPTNVEYSTDGGASWTTRSPASTASPLAIGGLQNGATYPVKLRVIGPGGTGADSAAVAATPADPNARTITITPAPAASYALDAVPPTIQATPSTGAGTITYATSTPAVCAIDEMTGVVSFNAAGLCTVTASVGPDGQLLAATSAPVTFRVLPIAPGSPSISAVTPGNGALTVAFSLGATGGEAPTNIEYSTDGGSTWTARTPASTASPLVIGGLRAGTTYGVRLRVVGAGGIGASSTATSGTPYGVPDAPTAVTAVASIGAATVRWSAPATDNGSPITQYVVTAAPGGDTCLWTSGPLECTLASLTAGTAYTFTVRARNAAGLGADSAPSAPVTPTAPAQPAGGAGGSGSQPPLTTGPVEVPGEPPVVRDDGSTRVQVRCSGAGGCPTTVAYVIGRETVASKRQIVPANSTADLALRLPPALQDRLAQRGSLRITVVVIVETDAGPVRSQREMVLEAPLAEAAGSWVMAPMPNGDTSVSALCIGDRATRCAGTISFFLKEGARARTLVGFGRIAGQGGQPMSAVVALNATGRRVLRERGSLAVDRVISMPGIAIRGQVAIAGGTNARITRLTDREWLIRTLDVLMRGAYGRAVLERTIEARHSAQISAREAVRIMQRTVLPERRRTLERVRLLPLPSKRHRAAHAQLVAAVERSIANDRIYLRAFQQDDVALWTQAWFVRQDALAAKRALIAEFRRIGARVGVDVPWHPGVWP